MGYRTFGSLMAKAGGMMLMASTGPAMADEEANCFCTKTFESGVTISSSTHCEEEEFCSCEWRMGANGQIEGVRAICLPPADPEPVPE